MVTEITQTRRISSVFAKVHLIAILVFLYLSLITTRAILFGDSLFIYRDINPSEPSAFLDNALSVFDLEGTRRLLYLGPYFAAVQSLGLSTLTVQKLSLFVAHFIIGFLAYLASYKFLASKIKNNDRKRTIFFVSIIFGFFYLYNPRVSEGLSLTGLGIGLSYALIPLIFYYFDRMLNEKGFYNIFVSGILIALAIAGTLQFLVLLPLFVLFPWLVIVTIRRLSSKKPMILTIKNFLILLGFWVLLSSYWLVFTIRAITTGVTPQPSYLLTNQTLDIFSSTTTLVNIVRLMGTWWPWINLTPIIDQSLWTALSFFIPIFLVLSILFLKDKRLKFYSLSFALIVLFIIFFNKGNQPPLTGIYSILYDVPIVGWMFRLPSALGKFLPFYMGMIITIGLYSLISFRAKRIQYLKYGMAGMLLLSISLVSWPMFTGDFGGIYKNNEPFIDNRSPEKSYQFSALEDNVMVFGQSGKISNLLATFNNSALISTDNSLNLPGKNQLNPDKIILDNNQDLLFHFLDSHALIVKPFGYTRDHDPSRVWSVAGSNDPLHGPFHEYLKRFDINNTDTDYGQGLVITWGEDELDMPVHLQNGENYTIFLRYLQNEAAGKISIAIDNEYEKILSTNGQSNRFIWENIGTTYLPEGKHVFQLRSVGGFNAVNVFVLIPTERIPGFVSNLDNFVNNSKLVYMLDKSGLIPQGRFLKDEHLINSEEWKELATGELTTRELTTPEEATHLSLEFGALGNTDSKSSYTIKDLSIMPVYDRLIFTSNFEKEEDFNKWKLASNPFLSIADETQSPISGGHSMKINIRNGTTGLWQIIYSDKIPVRSNLDLNFQFTIFSDSASPHAKVIYYDKDGKIINADTIFRSPSSNYLQSFQKTIKTPWGTRYIALQFWAMPHPLNSRTFMIDDIRIERLLPEKLFQNTFNIFENMNTDDQEVITDKNAITVNMKENQNNLTSWNIIQTRLIPVNEDLKIKYDLDLIAEHVNGFYAKVIYYSNVQEKLGESVTIDGKVHADLLRLPSEHSAYAKINLLKSSNYTIAINAMTCQECKSLIVTIGSTSREFSLHNNNTAFQWFYFTEDLAAGSRYVKFQSEGDTQIENVMIYSRSYPGETLDKMLAVSQVPTIIINQERVSSTRYEIKTNSTSPFTLSFDRKYNGLWSASVNGKDYDSFVLYPSKNGFYIQDTGLLDIIIEYKPQKWFVEGSIVTVITMMGSAGFLLWQRRQRITAFLTRSKTNIIAQKGKI